MRYFKSISVILLAIGVLMFCPAFLKASQERAQMSEKILSKDFAVAKEALNENKRLKNVEMIRLSLKHYSLIIKRLAAEDLAELGDKGSVPSLIEALEKNQGLMRGGIETLGLQAELNSAIVSTLGKLTGMSFPSQKSLTGTQIKQVIEQAKLWWNANKQQLKQ
jgi:hypothetical protein